MCWSNYMATPIVLKKPLRVYKVGTSTTFDNFISLFQDYVYHKCQTMPTVEINPELTQYNTFSPLDKCWTRSTFCINEGYHSYLDQAVAKYKIQNSDTFILKCIIPKGTKYAENRDGELVSSTIIITKEIA